MNVTQKLTTRTPSIYITEIAIRSLNNRSIIFTKALLVSSVTIYKSINIRQVRK